MKSVRAIGVFMAAAVTLCGFSMLGSCVGDGDIVGEHTYAAGGGILVTVPWDGTSSNDKICLHSTYSAWHGWHDWACNWDPGTSPTDITTHGDVTLNIAQGNDTVVVRNASSGGCSCACDVDYDTYGSIQDFHYSGGKSVTIVDAWMSGGEWVSDGSGNDYIYSGSQGVYSYAGDGTNTFRGGYGHDEVRQFPTMGDHRPTGKDYVWDPGGSGETWYLGLGDDKLYDADCDVYWPAGGGYGCALGTDDSDMLNNDEGCFDDCEGEDYSGDLSQPSCPSLPFPYTF